jgi:hypothetical protein
VEGSDNSIFLLYYQNISGTATENKKKISVRIAGSLVKNQTRDLTNMKQVLINTLTFGGCSYPFHCYPQE